MSYSSKYGLMIIHYILSSSIDTFYLGYKIDAIYSILRENRNIKYIFRITHILKPSLMLNLNHHIMK